MNNYLFSQNVLLLPALLSSVLAVLFFREYKQFWRRRKRLYIASGLGIGLFVAIALFVVWTVGLDNTPAASYYMVLACTIMLSAVIFYPKTKRRKRQRIIGGAAICSVILLLIATINSFYQYYPTVGTVFGQPISSNETTTSISHSSKKIPRSIEARLFPATVPEGTITSLEIPGTTAHFQARSGYLYTPPAYSTESAATTDFPVIVLLTGTPGTPSSWLQSGSFKETMNEFALKHHGITPMVAIVDHSGSFSNDTECLNSPHGNAETYLTSDVPNYLKDHYRVAKDPANWALAGFSEGGMCAAMLTLNHQDTFRHFLDLSGDPNPFLNDQSQTLPVLFNGSEKELQEHNIDWLIAHRKLASDLTGQFAIGAADKKSLVASMRHTYDIATKYHMNGSLQVMDNQAHNFGFWSAAYRSALPQLSYYLGSTDCPDEACGSN